MFQTEFTTTHIEYKWLTCLIFITETCDKGLTFIVINLSRDGVI